MGEGGGGVGVGGGGVYGIHFHVETSNRFDIPFNVNQILFCFFCFVVVVFLVFWPSISALNCIWWADANGFSAFIVIVTMDWTVSLCGSDHQYLMTIDDDIDGCFGQLREKPPNGKTLSE